ncbi:hypothetical protein Q3G72_002284 [Acer saccharum]|nr:hypothetical protein Q3G72_002284 [Acer saccharum]
MQDNKSRSTTEQSGRGEERRRKEAAEETNGAKRRAAEQQRKPPLSLFQSSDLRTFAGRFDSKENRKSSGLMKHGDPTPSQLAGLCCSFARLESHHPQPNSAGQSQTGPNSTSDGQLGEGEIGSDLG